MKNFLTKEQERSIVEAIKEAEKNTSGEIRVHIESKCKIDVLDRAVSVFNYLKMDRTAERNGVLIYVATISKKFAIIGDECINNRVPDNFWDSIKQKMGEAFSEGAFADGLCVAIKEAGVSLQKFFPYSKDDINEQSDEISYGKE